MPAPIALFAYKRADHLRQAVESLLRNAECSQSHLFFFSDAPRKRDDEAAVEEVRRYIATVKGFASVTLIVRENNLGLANSIISGVSQILASYDRVIVLEDDLVLSPYFLRYMNQALDLYANDENVASIHGYVYPVKPLLPETFFMKGTDCWGWGTWKRAWHHFEPDANNLITKLVDAGLTFSFDMDGSTNNMRMLTNQSKGLIDSWAIRWHASAYLKGMYTLYPGTSLVNNIGADGGGTHTDKTRAFHTIVSNTPIDVKRIPVAESKEARHAFIQYFKATKPGILERMLRLVKKTIRK